jgi:hypothetical protein
LRPDWPPALQRVEIDDPLGEQPSLEVTAPLTAKRSCSFFPEPPTENRIAKKAISVTYRPRT